MSTTVLKKFRTAYLQALEKRKSPNLRKRVNNMCATSDEKDRGNYAGDMGGNSTCSTEEQEEVFT